MPRCDECGRRFDLFDPTDADEWHYGHDCEPAQRERAVPCQHLGCRNSTWRNNAICEIHDAAR